MEKNKQSKYGCITKEKIEEIVNDIIVHTKDKERDFKFRVYFSNQKQADDWMEMFNNLLKEEIKNYK